MVGPSAGPAGSGKREQDFHGLEGVFGDVSVDIGEPFELANDDSLTLQRISHRAIEEIARNKLIHPTQLVARAMQGVEWIDIKSLRKNVEQEVESITDFFKTRYRKEPPFHPIITSDLPAAITRGVRLLTRRRAVNRSLFRRAYSGEKAPCCDFTHITRIEGSTRSAVATH